jgi:hypothetical protein
LDLESLKIQRSGFDIKSNLTSAIGNLANRSFPPQCHGLWHLPPQMKLSDVKIMQKKPVLGKKLTVTIREIMKDLRIGLLSKKHKILWEWEKN